MIYVIVIVGCLCFSALVLWTCESGCICGDMPGQEYSENCPIHKGKKRWPDKAEGKV